MYFDLKVIAFEFTKEIDTGVQMNSDANWNG